MKHELFVNIDNGSVVNRKPLAVLIQSLPTGRYLFTIEPKSRRTSPQNRYMHLMFTMIQQGYYNNGYREIKYMEQAKYLMKKRFLSYEIDNGTGGKETLIKRTRDLTKEQMSEFIDECIQFAAENLSVVIPPPNTQIMIFQEQENV